MEVFELTNLQGQPYTVNINRVKSLASYSDLNPNFGQAVQPDLLFDKAAISQALRNIFSTIIGEAGPIFEPEFGSILPMLLHEPFDDDTKDKILVATIQAAQRWEPRIDIDFAQSNVALVSQMPGYQIFLVYTIRHTGELGASRFTLPAA